MKTIFLSDIHIGTDAVTNLYKTDTNQANLKRILSYIQNNGHQIKDVVILGDWVDLWMYPSSIVPPTVQQIMDANPSVFTRQTDGSGDFISCMDSIQGNLHYINGNHDITVTSKDINDRFQPASNKGKRVHYVDCSKEGYTSHDGIIYGEHGHWYSMVCRPYRGEVVPFGYYMTRAGMQIIADTQKSLPPIDVLGIQQLISYNGLTFARAMLTLQANQLGFTKIEDLIFTMPDGSTISADVVADKFPHLFINELGFLRTDVGGSLDEFAKQLLESENKYNHKIVVFGHTHIKELNNYGFENYPLIYANSGFLCANEPDSNDISVSTFVEIEDNGKGSHTVSLIKLDYATGAFTVDKTITIK